MYQRIYTKSRIRPFVRAMIYRYKGIAVLLALLLISALLSFQLFSKPGKAAQWSQSFKSQPHVECPKSLNWLDSLDLAYPVHYARRDIRVNPRSDIKRKSITRIDERLFLEPQRIDLTEDSPVELQNCLEPLVLEVPAVPRDARDASHIMLGISTTLDRLDATIPQLRRWIPHTKARLFVIVIESEKEGDKRAVAADPQKKKDLEEKMRALDMDVRLVEPLKLQESFAEKYFSLLKIMYDNKNGNTEWISTMDDDTFFPSMHGIVSMLSRYDPQEMHYVGGLSEEWWAVMHYGMMAFGGGGIFISIALAEVMVNEYDHCKHATKASAGDLRIMECIYELTDIKLENERDLHQIDVHGDLSGLLESGRQIKSLHHWKPGAATEEGYDLPQMHQITDVCKECFLQRWHFDNDVILSNGFSISEYPNGLKGVPLDRMEETWSDVPTVEASNNHGVDHSLGPTRPKFDLGKDKIQYQLIHSTRVNEGVRQAYFRKGVNGSQDTVLELFWTSTLVEEILSLST